MLRKLTSLLATLPAVLLYCGALPWLAIHLDEWSGLTWPFPVWLENLWTVRRR